ncbi:hypothetical protein HDU98_001808 [Podochytrium sp. JEL0797]|nr:hypothetical protein HDU98_001808 [Podochytrium sp. JEL0797]
MYDYAQYRHESKKWFSRVYLICVNVILFGLAVGVILGGAAILKVVTDDPEQFDSVTVISMSRDIAIALLACGSILTILSLIGTIGACTRHTLALKTYIFGILLYFLAALVGGIIFLVKLSRNSAAWSVLGEAGWMGFSDYQRDMYQTIYTCCGFSTDHTDVYTAAPLFDIAGRTTNQCATPSIVASSMNCYDGGNMWYHAYTVASWSLFVAVLVFLITAIGAADHSKMRTSDVGYQVVVELEGRKPVY